ncbi:hypothetical protein TNCV_395061 [Trichonephila clavipes]|nr:hypothetical protein TNCV_395061 [Trichonephila clavipes]
MILKDIMTNGNTDLHVFGRVSVAAQESVSQERVKIGRFLCHDGSGQHKATSDREDILTVRSAVTAFDSLLSTIKHAKRSPVFTMIIHRRLIEPNLHSYPTATYPATPACTLSSQITVALDSIRLESC